MEICPIGNNSGQFCEGTVQPNELAAAIIEIENIFLSPRDQALVKAKLGEILARVSSEDFSALTPEQKLKHLHQILINEFSLRFRRQEIPNRPGVSANLFSLSLLSGRVDCDVMSQLFLIIGQELNWPLHLVRAPRHVFIRWQDNNYTFNYETTDNWLPTDQEYIDHFKIPAAGIKSGAYLRTLSEEEAKALVYLTRGRVRGEFGDWAGAKQDMARAAELNPQDFSIIKDLGLAEMRLGDNRGALRSFEQARRLDPADRGIEGYIETAREKIEMENRLVEK